MRISELVIACFNLDEMLAFYQNVFNIEFKDVKIPKGVIYEAHTDGLKITLCPATLAGIKAQDNRQQLTFQIDDIETGIKKVEKLGGSLISELQETHNHIDIAIKDVDGNSIILREL